MPELPFAETDLFGLPLGEPDRKPETIRDCPPSAPQAQAPQEAFKITPCRIFKESTDKTWILNE